MRNSGCLLTQGSSINVRLRDSNMIIFEESSDDPAAAAKWPEC
jgi:hypothetical protein